MKLNEFKNKLNDMLGDKHINVKDQEEKKGSKKEDNLLQQKKVLNNIFEIYNDALLNKIKE